MSSTPSQQNNGIGFPGALAIAFIVLKLTHVIAWSWWWVLSPLWIGFVVVIAFFVIAFVAVVIASLFR
jgi:Transmembrane Fragile-X-F protein.